jgi:endonuclease YncB( thermonuclease family)
LRWQQLRNILFIIMFAGIALQSSGLIDQVTGRYKVIDGDSLEYKGSRIRLKGIDAPELSQTCENDSGRSFDCGRDARSALQSIIGRAEIDCSSSTKDRYGRKLAYCTKGEIDINAEMVRQGWAIAYERHITSYTLVQLEAERTKRGLWAGTFEAPEDYRKRHRRTEGSLGDTAEDDD